MRETVKKAGKGPRGSHRALLASVKGTYQVYRPTNHDRSWKFSDHVTGDRTMQPIRDRDRDRDRETLIRSKRTRFVASHRLRARR